MDSHQPFMLWLPLALAVGLGLAALPSGSLAEPPPDKVVLLDSDRATVWCCHPCVKVFPTDRPATEPGQAAVMYG